MYGSIELASLNYHVIKRHTFIYAVRSPRRDSVLQEVSTAVRCNIPVKLWVVEEADKASDTQVFLKGKK